MTKKQTKKDQKTQKVQNVCVCGGGGGGGKANFRVHPAFEAVNTQIICK